MCKLSKVNELFENYRWLLRELNVLKAEIKKVQLDNHEGLASRSTIDPNCEDRLRAEYNAKKSSLVQIEQFLDRMPNTKPMLQCKLYLRLHYLAGYNLTETAMEMDVSLSTLNRIKQRCDEYLKNQVL